MYTMASLSGQCHWYFDQLIYRFSELGTFKILSTTYFEILGYWLSNVIVLLCFKTLEVIPPINCMPEPIKQTLFLPAAPNKAFLGSGNHCFVLCFFQINLLASALK